MGFGTKTMPHSGSCVWSILTILPIKKGYHKAELREWTPRLSKEPVSADAAIVPQAEVAPIWPNETRVAQ
jgi:hypothetical protein